jgi:hypothetical protein
MYVSDDYKPAKIIMLKFNDAIPAETADQESTRFEFVSSARFSVITVFAVCC